MVTKWLAVLVLALSLQLHGLEAAASPQLRCYHAAGTQRPAVFTIGGTVRVDNRCNELTGLVVVWRMYENSSETFHAAAGSYTSEPTLHYGRMRVWVRYPDGSEFLYWKVMKP